MQTRGTSLISGVKGLAQKHIKVVHSEGKFPEKISGLIVKSRLFKAFGSATEAYAQGNFLIEVAKLPQQAPHLIGPLLRGSDNLQGCILFGLAGLHALE